MNTQTPSAAEQMLDLMIESAALAMAPVSIAAWAALAWIRLFDAGGAHQRRTQPPFGT